MILGSRFFFLLLISLAVCLSPVGLFPAQAASDRPSLHHHDLFVQIVPDQHELVATDRVTLAVPDGSLSIRLSLAPTLHVDRISLVPPLSVGDASTQDLPFEIQHGSSPQLSEAIVIPTQLLGSGTKTLKIQYHGVINDPPRDPRHLRFVTPSETAGHIGSEGVYLSSESQWYPDVPESLSTYAIRVAVPEGWQVVTQGQAGHTQACTPDRCRPEGMVMTEWAVTQKTEAVTLVANRFVTKVRDWQAKTGQTVQLATYLFPEDGSLADEYLDATARYLDAYIPLLGTYPFEKFAVVENFFSSGLGMPSFTLLGSGVIKRHYVQPYALGHEIVHSWIGNSVFNRVDQGNWVEGLTTYLANYYWHELTGDQTQAREQRRLMLQGYNLYVTPERDYPVGQFTHKRDERDNAIGYQKAAMVFHLLRQEIGDEAFWRALKELVMQYRGQHTAWRDVERVFTDAARQDLRWFFVQWVEQAGAPALSLSAAAAHPIRGDQPYRLDAMLTQATAHPFRAPLHLRIRMEGGREQTVPVVLRTARETFSLSLPARPLQVELDPDFMTIRRIARSALSPVLNHYVTDRHRSVVRAFSDTPAAPSPLEEVIQRIAAQDANKPAEERTTILSLPNDGLLPQEGSVLLLGGPESRVALQSIMNKTCGERIALYEQGVIVMGTSHEGPGTATLVTCHRIDQPGSVVTLLYAITLQAAVKVSRLLFFYGWSSAVLFKDGTVVTRMEWSDTTEQTEVRFDAGNLVQ